jgi:Outer membrane protein beta-barrel domain
MKIKLAVMILGLLLPLCATAQTLQFGAGIRASVLSYNKDQIDQSHLFWGGQARLRIIKYFAAEASLQTREDDFHIHNGDIKLKTVPFQLSGMVYPLAMFPVSPYVVFGTGWYSFTLTVTGDLGLPYVTGEGSIKLSTTAAHVGVGVEAFIGKHVGVGADVRKVFVNFDNPLIRNLKFDAYMVNIMGTFYF